MTDTERVIVTLQIEGRPLDDIVAGRKPEEYRSLSRYNAHKLCKMNPEDNKWYPRTDVTHLQLINGYRPDARRIIVEVKGIYIDTFKNFVPDGMKPGSRALTIELGAVVEQINFKS